MSENIKKIRSIIIPILHQGGVVRSSIFGSYARGEETSNSDIDILVELPKGKSLLDLVDIENKIKSELDCDVDLITYASVHPRLKESIEKDAIQLIWQKTPFIYIDHIFESIELIEKYTAGISEEEFFKKKETQDSVMRRIEIIGEASKYLTEDFKNGHPEIPWKNIASMRDKLIHEYFGVDLALVFGVVKKDISQLKQALEKIRVPHA